MLIGSPLIASPAVARRQVTRRMQGGDLFRPCSDAEDTPQPVEAGRVLALTSLDGLLAVQASEAPEDRSAARGRAIQRGADLLDRLEEIRVALLDGRLGRGALESLRNDLTRQAAFSGEPALAALLRDIELRAEVELAKLECCAKELEHFLG